MGAARGMFDESKHPRGFHGRFGSGGRSYSARKVGRGGIRAVDLPYALKGGKGALVGGKHSPPHARTNVYSKIPGIRTRMVRYTTAAGTTKTSKQPIVGTGVFVNTGRGWIGKGLLGWGGQVGVKGRSHLGIKPKKAEQVGRHRARDVMGR